MVLKRVIQQFAELGMRPIAGPELEFYVLERTDKNPTGWQRAEERQCLRGRRRATRRMPRTD